MKATCCFHAEKQQVDGYSDWKSSLVFPLPTFLDILCFVLCERGAAVALDDASTSSNQPWRWI